MPGLPFQVDGDTFARALALAEQATTAAEQAAVADDVCSVLMGEDVEVRRNFIQTNAKDVRFLDI